MFSLSPVCFNDKVTVIYYVFSIAATYSVPVIPGVPELLNGSYLYAFDIHFRHTVYRPAHSISPYLTNYIIKFHYIIGEYRNLLSLNPF